MKRCYVCGRVKTFECFNKHSRNKDGLQQECKECRSRKRKEKVLNKPDKPREGVCLCCGETFVLLAKTRKYCSNNCKSKYNSTSLARVEWADKNLNKRMLYRAKYSAKKKGLPFNLEAEDIIIPEFCPVLGIKLAKSDHKQGGSSPSLDKIVPEKGYVKGNVRVISQRANLLKSNATIEELTMVLKDLTTILSEVD